MAYQGNTPALSYTSFAVQHFITSATTSYTLDYSVANENDIRLVINNVVQQPGSSYAYTASGTSLVLSSATSATDTMYAVFLGKAVQTVNPPDGSVSLAKLSATGTKDSTTFLRGDNTFASAQGVFESALLHVRDEKSNGTNGGTATSGSYQTRDLNTVVTNEISGSSLSSNQITLPSGSYFITCFSIFYDTNRTRIRLYNATDTSSVIDGISDDNNASNNVMSMTHLGGRFTIASSKAFEIQYQVATTKSGGGLGSATSFGGNEIYTDVYIYKVA